MRLDQERFKIVTQPAQTKLLVKENERINKKSLSHFDSLCRPSHLLIYAMRKCRSQEEEPTISETAAMKSLGIHRLHHPLWGAQRNGSNSNVSATLLVLISCNFVLLLSKLNPSPSADSKEMAVEPISFLGSRLSAVVMAYLSTFTYVGNRLSLQELFLRMRHTWRRPAITLMYIELFATASASLLLLLRAFAGATRGMFLEALLFSGSVALLSCLGPVLFAHSEIACKLSIVVSVVEEDCEGMHALKRAQELVKGRMLQGFILTIAMAAVEQAPFVVFGFEKGGNWGILMFIVAGPVLLVTKFATYLVYTVFYYECRNLTEKECLLQGKNCKFDFEVSSKSGGEFL
ncbi:uncharacterized protein LOC103701682 isoform X1 [Phoenix dactylifera]|uniref:Uncharacterized protein LOC103701682 isoform X1 n=1 Tax=Phoenix dactylifera TaxID=42345 RepID=A0A8B8J179_PHODC|nr:uncharacterized protein LOC103701682 isoform X1 [Phoenix dactylifera]